MVKPAPMIRKGDVVWAPYRRDPLWPALVRNSYPKKVTYIFFPLPPLDNPEALKKVPTFSCLPKHVRSLAVDDILPSSSKNDLKNAFKLAKQYLINKGLTRGSDAPPHFVKSTKSSSAETGSKETDISTEIRASPEKSSSTVPDKEETKQKEATEVDEKPCTEVNSNVTQLLSEGTHETAKEVEDKRLAIKSQPEESKISNVKSELNNVVGPAMKVATKRKASTEDTLTLAKRQPVSHSPPRPSAFAADSTTHSDTSPSPDLLAPTIFREAVAILERVWTTSLVQSYVTPPRSTLRFEMHTGGLLSDHETDSLFDLIFSWVRDREHDAYFLPGVHLVFEVLMPEVVIQSLVMSRGISREAAERMVRGTHSESITSSSSSTCEPNYSHSPGTAYNNG
ncbi:hypothetical protein OESDEN_05556 [Oesophagostomum dentatum]|uniref:PWWP domain-containing protein n=1 Tax=Oesophagostomum dentatum TaxID=61180 RepID=A0A0B1TFA6_OESDE|nr:hypothetical protein OESDEN_05556 [Oesophagostomum dentatum]